MSGIVGVFHRDGRQVEASSLARMIEALAHRGPDGSHAWLEGSIGFGHLMMWTTPESLQEKLPLQRGHLTITADARVDNREELIRVLGLDGYPTSEICDSTLILEAYKVFGISCLDRLVGDFAFSIWDSREKTLFCARDQLGVKPLFYYLSDRLYLFSSEIKGILSNSEVPKIINEERVGEHFFPMLIITNKRTTNYQDVFRLPPAHYLVVTPQNVRMSQYWSLDTDRETLLGSDDQYAQAFGELFAESVRNRLRSAYPVGSTLSGGLDSSSITCMARNIHISSGKEPLHTFSAVFNQVPSADESPYIKAVVDQGGLCPHEVYPDTYTPFIELDRVEWHLDGSFYSPNYFISWGLFCAAAEQGVRVLLEGTDGDTTVSHGMDRLAVLARQKQWSEFSNEAIAIVSRFDHPRYATRGGILLEHGAPYLAEMLKRGKLIDYARGVNALGSRLRVSRKKLLFYSGIVPWIPRRVLWGISKLRKPKGDRAIALSVINPDFLRRINLEKRLMDLVGFQKSLPTNGRSLHARYLDSGTLTYSLEFLNSLASAFALEVRFPFCDRRLVEFCLSLPSDQKLRQGWSRFVMRKAMEGILPDRVCWRGGKISLAEVNPHGIRAFAQDFIEEALANPPDLIKDYVNLSSVKSQYQKFIKEGDDTGLDWVFVTVIFAHWLRQTRLTSV